MNVGIKPLMLIALIPAALLMFSALIWISFEVGDSIVLTQINKRAFDTVLAHSKEFEVFFASTRMAAEGNATAVGSMEKLDKYAIQSLLAESLNLVKNKSLYGMTIALDPHATPLGEYSPYLCNSADGLVYSDLASPSYRYQERDWYKRPMREGVGSWSEPYFDVGGGEVLMTTYSAPVRWHDTLIGVSTMDINLTELVKRVKHLNLGPGGYAFIVSKGGWIIGHPQLGDKSGETIYQLAEHYPNSVPPSPTATGGVSSSQHGHPPVLKHPASLSTVLQILNTPSSDLVDMTDPFTGRLCFVIDAPIGDTGWDLVISYPREEVLEPLKQLRNKVSVAAFAVAGLLVVIILVVSSTLTKPISRLVAQAGRYARGDFAVRLPEEKGTLEIRRLSESFNRMGQDIVKQMETIRTTTAQKERYRQELVIAAEIQQSILPQQFPPFPELADKVELFGLTRPAKEVGGDFYDFIRLDGNRVAVVVGDVSGKGAPSALFMAMARMLVRETAAQGYSPGEVLRRANYELLRENTSSMFVTLLYAEYNTCTGLTRIACAGHFPPLRSDRDGQVELIPVLNGLPLGVMDGTRYDVVDFTLSPGESLLLYTDGVTEAMDPNDNEYGTGRLREVVGRHAGKGYRAMVDALLADIEAFAQGRDQSDDITLLLLKRIAPTLVAEPRDLARSEEVMRLRVPARETALPAIYTLVAEAADHLGFSEADTALLLQAVEEAAAGVIQQAYPPNSRESLSVKVLPMAGGIQISLIDYGSPLGIEKPFFGGFRDKPTRSREDVRFPLACRVMDELRYESDTREGNRLVMTKWRQSSPRTKDEG